MENCGVRHAPDVDAEMGWRVASVDRDATIFCRGENFMAGVGMGQEGVIWKGGEAQFNLRGGGGRILVEVTYHWSPAEVHALCSAGARAASDSGSSMR